MSINYITYKYNGTKLKFSSIYACCQSSHFTSASTNDVQGYIMVYIGPFMHLCWKSCTSESFPIKEMQGSSSRRINSRGLEKIVQRRNKSQFNRQILFVVIKN